MALFGKKKEKVEPETSVTFTETTFTYNDYNPWDTSKGNADNDFANSVFLWLYSTKARPLPKTPDDYPRYVSYELGIYDPIRKFNELLSTGFIETAHERAALSTYKVAELKKILETHNLSTKGKKDDLLSRIIEEVDLKGLSLPSYYTLSEKGFAFIKEHDDLIKLHSNPYNISYEEYIETKQSYPYPVPYNDLVWAIFNKRETQISIEHNGGRGNNALHRAMLLKSENRLIDALSYYIIVLYSDINDFIIKEEQHKNFMKSIGEKDDEPYQFVVAPYIKEVLLELKSHYTEEMIIRCSKHLIYPEPKISQANFKRLLFDLFNEIDVDLDNYL